MNIHTLDTYLKSWMPPFILALGGIISDYISTTIGLGLGFHETNPQYHPLWALLYFWGALTVLTLTLPKSKNWKFIIYVLALTTYIGLINNILVILGVFPGIGCL